MEIASDALLLPIGDLNDLPFEALALGHVVEHRQPVVRASHLQRGENARRDEARSILARALQLDR